MALPLVSILTPVYNGEKYLAECIESIRSQHYRNWEYLIVNNCSTDATADLAGRYVAADPRIRIFNNRAFVGIEENHNIAFSLVSPESKYCKVVSADDWIAPDCIGKLVELAELHPTVAIVGSYQRSSEEIKWKGLPRNVHVVSGREVCRECLSGSLDVLGAPTSCLYRADLVRGNKPFFPHLLPHADTSACYKYLQNADFGFVHEVLSTERIHEQQASSKVNEINMGAAAHFHNLLEYGPVYFSEEELETRINKFLEGYYRFLGGCMLKLRERAFWKYQTGRFKELGYPILWRKVIKGAIDEVRDEMQQPRNAFHKLMTVVNQKYRELLKKTL
ncbi:MAG TPA: glycosyltransferase family 2 protein [Dissulfurispiraceae bacterium]